MSAPRLPRRLVLPSGLRVTLEARTPPRAARDAANAPLFDATWRLLQSGDVVARKDDRGAVDPGALSLEDFHVLRAVLTRSGFIAEDDVLFPCRNCGAEVRARPCEALEIGPYVDDELDDDELDATTLKGEPVEIAGIPLGRVRSASTVTLRDVTVADAAPLFTALSRTNLEIDADVVRAMGIDALGPEHDPTHRRCALDRR